MIVIALLVVAGSATVYWASLNTNRGVYWADQICRHAQPLCDDPRWLLIVVMLAIGAALLRQMMKA
jgi:hypothetical protein